MTKSAAAVLAIAALCICARTESRGYTQAPAPAYSIPSDVGDEWQTGRADAHRLVPSRLERLTAAIEEHAADWNIHALLIERDGRLVYERYFTGTDERWGVSLGRVTFDRSTKHDLRSVTKSVLSALMGTLVGSEAIPTLDTPLVRYFPEYPHLQTDQLRAVTLRHALTMTAGFDWNEDIPYTNPKNDEIVMIRSADPLGYALGRPLIAAPGTIWKYNGGLTQLLAAVVQRASKTPLSEYAQRVLFGPLGISDFEWLGNLAGMPSAASGLRLRPRDLAKFGSLHLNQGRWQGRQVIPAAWVEESTRRHVTFPKQTSAGYGFQWWHNCVPLESGPIEARSARGNGGQRVVIFPALRATITILAGRYNAQQSSESILRDFVVSAFESLPKGSCSTG